MSKSAKRDESEIELREKYTYNRDQDTYVTPLKSRAKPLVLSGAKHRAIIRALSATVTPAMTVEEVALKFQIPVKYLEEYKKIHALTRDTLPLSAEEIEEQDVNTSAQQMMEEKRFAISQAYEKLDWKETQNNARAWLDFQNGILDPFAVTLDTWTPPKLPPLRLADPFDVSEKVLVIGLSDLHYGAASNERYMYNRPSWTSKDTVAAVDAYAKSVIRSVNERNYKFQKAIVLGLGDLIHSVNGKTSRGTELKFDTIREEQFEYALNSLMVFLSRIAEVVPLVEVHSVYGNHNYEAEMALFRALEKAFRNEANFKFFHYSSRPAAFREGSTMFLLDHGADSVERAYVPTGSDSKLQLHVQSLLLQTDPKLLLGTKSRLFCMGDKHHWEHLEYNDFEFIMFGTILLTDEHSAVNNLRNRARQSCLVLDDNGLKEVIHFYADTIS